MTPQEQAAFVKAYANHVGLVRTDDVAETVRRHYAGEDVECREYNSILDALGIWHSAVKWQIEQIKEALDLSMNELNRHARDTESGERAVQAVQTALGATA
jgi:hypothetical protein